MNTSQTDYEVSQEPGEKKHSIRRRVFWLILAFVLLIIIAVGTTVCCGFVVLSSRHFLDDTFEMAKAVSLSVDSSRAAEYLKTGGKDTAYEKTGEYMSRLVEATDLQRIAIIYPGEEEIVCLWDTGKGQTADGLGDHEKYPDDNRRKELILESFHHNSRKSWIMDRIGDEKILTVYCPVYNAGGEPEALVSVYEPVPDNTAG